jgi:hypothetical protein
MPPAILTVYAEKFKATFYPYSCGIAVLKRLYSEHGADFHNFKMDDSLRMNHEQTA